MLGTKSLAVKIADESIVSGSLLTVESNHFCVLKSRGAVLNIYETGQYALTTPDKPIFWVRSPRDSSAAPLHGCTRSFTSTDPSC